MAEKELREKIACSSCVRESDCDSSPTLNSIPKHIHCENQLKWANEILDLIKEGKSNCCYYCGGRADGAMLVMSSLKAHAICVIRKLKELVDCDYDSVGEPDKIVGFLAGKPELKECVPAIVLTALEEQAEISFKAGIENEAKRECALYYEDGKQVGIRKVVDWLERTKKIKVPKYQLKEWGID